MFRAHRLVFQFCGAGGLGPGREADEQAVLCRGLVRPSASPSGPRIRYWDERAGCRCRLQSIQRSAPVDTRCGGEVGRCSKPDHCHSVLEQGPKPPRLSPHLAATGPVSHMRRWEHPLDDQTEHKICAPAALWCPSASRKIFGTETVVPALRACAFRAVCDCAKAFSGTGVPRLRWPVCRSRGAGGAGLRCPAAGRPGRPLRHRRARSRWRRCRRPPGFRRLPVPG